MMPETLALCLATYAHIALKACQQLNVIHHKVWWVPPTSLALACVEVFVVAKVARAGWEWWVVLPVAIGASAGCLSAMWWHQRRRARHPH